MFDYQRVFLKTEENIDHALFCGKGTGFLDMIEILGGKMGI